MPLSRTEEDCRPRAEFPLSEFWILLCAWCSALGWTLSALKALNGLGYTVGFLIGLCLFFVWKRKRWPAFLPPWPRQTHFKKPIPFLFALTATLAFIGGALYAPSNYDALTYRFPRVLHWITHSGWHWIDTGNDRMNFSGTGFEWLMAPVFIFTKSDRAVFLINTCSFLLLPGLLFRFFKDVGLAPRTAWFWMWLLPLGYCFALQAGSVGNDTFATVYFLAAIVFARSSLRRKSAWELCLALLSAALLTGVKSSNLPLLLPIAIALVPSLPWARMRPLGVTATLLAGIVISFAPIAFANFHYSHDWTGDPANLHGVKLENPAYAFTGNALQLLIQNANPPVAPMAKAWNNFVLRELETPAGTALRSHYPRVSLQWGELATEEAAGVGAGLLLLLFISCGSALIRNLFRLFAWHDPGFWITASVLAALVVYMAKLGSESEPRLIATYYPGFFAFVLRHPANIRLSRSRIWRALAIMVAASALLTVILTPSRPLFPAVQFFDKLSHGYPRNISFQRAATVYNVYSQRADGLAPLRHHLPSGAKRVGFISADDPQVALWRPFGSREIVDLSSENTNHILSQLDVPCIAASEPALSSEFNMTPENFAVNYGYTLAGHERVLLKIARGPEDWYVFQKP